jgi:hypothetical protein
VCTRHLGGGSDGIEFSSCLRPSYALLRPINPCRWRAPEALTICAGLHQMGLLAGSTREFKASMPV